MYYHNEELAALHGCNTCTRLLYMYRKPVRNNKTSFCCYNITWILNNITNFLFIFFFFVLSRVGGRKGRRQSFAGGCRRPSLWSLSLRSHHHQRVQLTWLHSIHRSAVTAAAVGSVRLRNRSYPYNTPHGCKSYAHRVNSLNAIILYYNIIYIILYLNAS